MAVIIDGKTLDTDPQGYLQHWDDWNEHVASQLAAAEGIELADSHWEIVRFLREYYQEYKIAPAVRVLIKTMARRLGEDKGNSKYLYQLFPYGPAKQACKIAGLPKPTGCI